LKYSTSLPGLRSLYLLTASISDAAAPEPLPWVMKRMPWSIAALQLDQAFLRAALVVKADELELLAHDATLLVDQDLGGFLEALEAGLADVGEGAGKRVDVGDLDG
jgi:hypothetical protein